MRLQDHNVTCVYQPPHVRTRNKVQESNKMLREPIICLERLTSSSVLPTPAAPPTAPPSEEGTFRAQIVEVNSPLSLVPPLPDQALLVLDTSLLDPALPLTPEQSQANSIMSPLLISTNTLLSGYVLSRNRATWSVMYHIPALGHVKKEGLQHYRDFASFCNTECKEYPEHGKRFYNLDDASYFDLMGQIPQPGFRAHYEQITPYLPDAQISVKDLEVVVVTETLGYGTVIQRYWGGGSEWE
ncbi:hypothetical protein BJX64DRAFT_286324 [Aspergillus heterothallicus]